MFLSIRSRAALNGPQRDPKTLISLTTTSFKETDCPSYPSLTSGCIILKTIWKGYKRSYLTYTIELIKDDNIIFHVQYYLLVVDFKTIVPFGFTNLHALTNPEVEPEQSIMTSKSMLKWVMVEYVFIALGTLKLAKL